MHFFFLILVTLLAGCTSTDSSIARPEVAPTPYPLPDFNGVVDTYITTDLSAQAPSSDIKLVEPNDPNFTPPRLTKPILDQRSVRAILKGFTCPVRGRVAVAALIDKDGSILVPQLRRGIHELCDAKAIEAIKNISITPAKYDDEPIAMAITLPINFD